MDHIDKSKRYKDMPEIDTWPGLDDMLEKEQKKYLKKILANISI